MTNRMRERGQHVLKTREYWQQRMKKKLAGAQMELPRSTVLPENRQTQTESSEEQSPVQYAEERVEENEQRTVRAAEQRTGQAVRYVANKVRLQKQQREEVPPVAVSHARNTETVTSERQTSMPVNIGRKAKPAKTAKKAGRAAQSTAQSAQTAKRNLQRAGRETVKAVKTAWKMLKEAAKAVAAGVTALVKLIVAGGWVSVVIILVILIVAFILCSPLGIFYANDTAEGMPMTQAIAQVNAEFYEEIQNQIDYVAQVSDYDAMQVVYEGVEDGDSPMVNNWIDVLGVYAVMMTMDEQSATDVVTVTPDKVDALRKVFRTMNEVEYEIETETSQTEVIVGAGEDAHIEIIEHTTLTLRITLTSLNYTEGADRYWFTAEERALLDELMGPEFVPLFANLLGTDPHGGFLPNTILQSLPPNEKGSAIVQAALTKAGCKYVWGAKGPNQFDCSGFVCWCLREAGVSCANSMCTSAAGQAQYCYNQGWVISQSDLQPGDLVFWQNAACTKGDRWNEIHHTGIYIGEGKVIEASSSKGCVVIRNLWSSVSYPLVLCGRVT